MSSMLSLIRGKDLYGVKFLEPPGEDHHGKTRRGVSGVSGSSRACMLDEPDVSVMPMVGTLWGRPAFAEPCPRRSSCPEGRHVRVYTGHQ